MKKQITLLIAFFVLVIVTSSFAMPFIPRGLKKVVAFVYVEKKGKWEVNGTGFFVGVKIPRQPETHKLYFVTSKHVLQKRDDRGRFLDELYPSINIRLEGKEGKAELGDPPLTIIREGPKKNVFFHEDSSVDLVVITYVPDPKRCDYDFVPDHGIATKEIFQKLRIAEGSEVFFIGLFWHHIGVEKNFPITRFGRVALISDEKIIWNGKESDLYLMECTSFGGNSGSPVFIYTEKKGFGDDPSEPIKVMLIGIMQGHFLEPGPIGFAENAKKVPIAGLNSGISAVVPAQKLYEILFSEELKNQRRNQYGE